MNDMKNKFKKFDFTLFIVMIILTCSGLYCIRQVGILNEVKASLYLKQLAGAAIGFGIIFVMLFIDYRFICKMSLIMYLGIVMILAYLLVFGNSLNNVKRWIIIAGIQFQPSELTKVVLILFLAFLCNHFKDRLHKFYVFFILGIVTAIPTVLIILEPHLSSGMAIFFIFCIMVYSSGISYKVMGMTLAVTIPVLAVLIISVTMFNFKIPFVESYQIERVLSFMSTDESEDMTGKYQQNQAITAIASGGLHGKMITDDNSDRLYKSIYANESDFIFSVVGEEFGFIGTGIIIVFYLTLVIRCIIIGTRAPDYMGKLICIGVSALFMFQIFINMGVATSILPNTGLSLPFISYGVTSLVSSMLAVGLVLNVGLRRKDML
jgi:rod shape determining protein RodA